MKTKQLASILCPVTAFSVRECDCRNRKLHLATVRSIVAANLEEETAQLTEFIERESE